MTPHPVIVATRDNKDYTKVLLYSYYTTITGWGVLLGNTVLIILKASALGYPWRQLTWAILEGRV